MSTYIITPTVEQEKLMAAFLEEQHISFIKDEEDADLPPHVLEGIARGEEDIKAGRFKTFEEFKKKYPID
jgi:predicted transcriptional regulator